MLKETSGTGQSWDLEAERDLLADACQSSLWNFARWAFGIESNPKGDWLCPRVHKPICDWFESHARHWLANRHRNLQKNLFIVIPRDFGKSVLITKCAMLWLHLQDPELSTFIGSMTKDMAIDFLSPIKEVMSGTDQYQLFTWLYGNWYDKNRDWTGESVVHAVRRGTATGEPSFGVWGAATGLTGRHPDVLCFDDPISYPRMETHSGWIDFVNRHVTSLIPVLKGNGLRVFIGTRYHDGDWIGRALNIYGAKSVSGMPIHNSEASPKGTYHFYFLAARDTSGKPIYPERWGEDALSAYEKDNAVEFYAQMMNDPTTEKVMALTRRQVDQLWVEGKDVPNNLRISVHIDTAFKYKERFARGDESVIIVMGHSRDGSGDVYYLEGYGSASWRAEDFNNKLTSVLKSLRTRGRWPFILTDEIELGGKQGVWELTIANWCANAGLPPPNIKLLSRAGKAKVSRHIAAASFWIDGKVRLVKEAPGVERLIDQMLKIGVSQRDDWADTHSDCFHPEVYRPMRLPFSEEESYPLRPYDEELQDGRWTVWGQIQAFRAAQRRDNESGGYSPVPIEL